MNNNFWRRGALALALAGTALPGCHKEERHEEVDFCIKCGDDRKLEEISRDCHDLLSETIYPERISVTGRTTDNDHTSSAIYAISDGQNTCRCEQNTDSGNTVLTCESQLSDAAARLKIRAACHTESDGKKQCVSDSFVDNIVINGRNVSLGPNGVCTEFLHGGFRSNQTPESQRACREFITSHSRKLDEIFEQLREKHGKQ